MQELLVSLVISSLIIGMVYTIYAQLNKQLFSYSQDQEEIMVFNQFRHIVSKDISLAKSIDKTGDEELEVIFPDKSHTYTFKYGQVIRDRENNIKDTFEIAIQKMELNQEVTGTVGDQTLTLTTSLLDEDIVLFENKSRSIADKINDLYLNEH